MEDNLYMMIQYRVIDDEGGRAKPNMYQYSIRVAVALYEAITRLWEAKFYYLNDKVSPFEKLWESFG